MIVAAVTGAVAAGVIAHRLLPARDGRTDWLAISTAGVAGAAALTISPDTTLEVTGFRVLLVVLAAAAVMDARTLRLPNVTSGAALLVAVAGWVAAGAHLAPLLVAASVTLFMLVGYLVTGAGAGDLKMLPPFVLAAVAPFADPALAITAGVVLWGGTFTAALGVHVLSGAGRSRSPLGPSMLLAGVAALTLI